jgi:hypothetical protein
MGRGTAAAVGKHTMGHTGDTIFKLEIAFFSGMVKSRARFLLI